MVNVLRTPGMLTAMAMAAAAFGGFGLLLPVVPLVIAQSGAGDAIAGATTATFMAATVATQLGAPALLLRFGHRLVLATGCLLLGLPSLLLLPATMPDAGGAGIVGVLAVSAVRGIGFGLLTVASAALVAELVPRAQIGRASGLQGIAIAATQMVALPAGLALLGAFGSWAPIVAGAVVPVLALVAIGRLPKITTPPGSAVPRGRLVLLPIAVPLAAIGAAAVANGGVTSLLPIAVDDNPGVSAAVLLALTSAAMIAGRYLSGVMSDRLGPGRVSPPGLVVSALGLAAVAWGVADGLDAALVLGVVVFGFGFGAVQNDSLVSIFAAAGSGRSGQASAVWNIGFDAGTGLGAFALGVVAAAAGYGAVFATSAAVAVTVPALVLAASSLLGRGRRGRG
ncbi:MFS transporter [Rhodococcus rhodnii]|uniref:Major facilitator transporter n=2 Tax=Rhodococcus rhodnii TaxID=38312 RepID=R7WTJ7_9NOCA|nr:MFS transporter [Rhodococcus rhodnii]EOM78578.1 major facilitator transporter [Rhodococcus rhodnii LMG 5362]TXG92751.1 MFS transporter [Rhodococcus rhodnii]